MPIGPILFTFILIVFIPLIGSLLYVWWKYGKNEEWIKVARGIYMAGVTLLLGCMVTTFL